MDIFIDMEQVILPLKKMTEEMKRKEDECQVQADEVL